MDAKQATQIVRFLVAAFRPRDWTDESSAVYIERLMGKDYEQSQRAARWLADHSRYMPTIAEILDAIKAQPTVQRPELPEPPGATPDEVVAIIAEGRERIRAAGPGERPLQLVREPKPIAVDMAEVERRKAAIRDAKARLG